MSRSRSYTDPVAAKAAALLVRHGFTPEMVRAVLRPPVAVSRATRYRRRKMLLASGCGCAGAAL